MLFSNIILPNTFGKIDELVRDWYEQGGKRGNKKVSKVIYSSDIFRKQESQ